MATRTLYIGLEDLNGEMSSISLADAKENITAAEIRTFEQATVAGNVFAGKTADVAKVAKAYVKEVTITDIL